MNMDEFKERYEELKSNPMYQKYCSVLETKDKIIKNLQSQLEQKEKQLNDIRELFEQYDIKYLRETTEHNLADFIEIGLEKLNIIERNNCESIEKLLKQNTELKDNWNKLKEWMNSEMERFEDNPYTRLGIAVFSKVLNKMQEIEKGECS